jgi:hypothetical protein
MDDVRCGFTLQLTVRVVPGCTAPVRLNLMRAEPESLNEPRGASTDSAATAGSTSTS